MCLDHELLQFETENRIRNLVWTVSEDYSLRVDPDVDLYFRSPSRGLYRAILQGAFFRRYDRKALSLYLLKKMYFGVDEAALSRAANMVMDAAVWRWVTTERPGVLEIRRKAAEEFTDGEFASRCRNALGRLELLWYGRACGGDTLPDHASAPLLAKLQELGEGDDGDVIRLVDEIYNSLVDPAFEQTHGDLAAVLSVTLEDLAEADFDWQDFLQEEAETDPKELPQADVPPVENPEGGEKTSRAPRVVHVDEEMRKKAYSYMELNYGRSYMNPMDQKRLNLTLCRGVHENCSLYFTDGILHNMVKKNYQSEYVRRQRDFNLTERKRCRTMANRNIQQLAHTMSQALLRRSEIDRVRSMAGTISPVEMWKPGRVSDSRLFIREIRQNDSDFVVDILMDASGSQHDRRGAVAVQGWIISEALSLAGIPHRVQSFCTCWDYTILQRFREYDDPREANERIMEFSTSANNRDGLAIKTVVHQLMQRREENRILIVLSDGRPNDRIVNRSVSRSPSMYVGDFAVFDTAEEVRKARNMGIAVLGVFAGVEEDLEAEKRIFGRDFAYIRDIRNFSHVVGRYLKRQLDATS